jgi:glutathione S-transferase
VPDDIALRYEALQWLMFQMASTGPMFGQLGFFHKFAGKKTTTSARAIVTSRKRSTCSTCSNSDSPRARGARADHG